MKFNCKNTFNWKFLIQTDFDLLCCCKCSFSHCTSAAFQFTRTVHCSLFIENQQAILRIDEGTKKKVFSTKYNTAKKHTRFYSIQKYAQVHSCTQYTAPSIEFIFYYCNFSSDFFHSIFLFLFWYFFFFPLLFVTYIHSFIVVWMSLSHHMLQI